MSQPIDIFTSMLFSPFSLRGVTFRNRIGVSPMCQYSSTDGFAEDWHFVHLGGLATGGAGLVFCEATAVTPEGRISPKDLGIWKDEHVPMLARIMEFVAKQGAVPGIQLAHAGRKASTKRPWEGVGQIAVGEGGWEVLGPSSIPFSDTYPMPHEMTVTQIDSLITSFRLATRRALAAGFQVIELHGAHGYLLHEFLSPLSNHRTDAYGGSLENRLRLTLEVVRAVRQEWPERLPLCLRISATDWTDGGWEIEQSLELARRVKSEGVDLIDCSSGGLVYGAKVPIGPGYQVPFAKRVRADAGIPTAAVGLITQPEQADAILRDGSADMVLLARELLRQPRWPLLAAHALGVSVPWPSAYERARPA
ncbi:MAG: NADH:flavin oxidoreductase/NADH oxidase [Gemmatimonadaceae bacterium]